MVGEEIQVPAPPAPPLPEEVEEEVRAYQRPIQENLNEITQLLRKAKHSSMPVFRALIYEEPGLSPRDRKRVERLRNTLASLLRIPIHPDSAGIIRALLQSSSVLRPIIGDLTR